MEKKRDKIEISRDKKILERILKTSGDPELLEVLTQKISMRDLQSLLLTVYRDRVDQIRIQDVKKQYQKNRFVQACDISQREFQMLDNLAYSILLEEFVPIELSPVNPFGLNNVLTKINQNTILSTIRNIEVIADIGTALALEYMKKRELLKGTLKGNASINLCASQRIIRLQQFTKESGFTPHFRIFALCTGGKDSGYESLKIETVAKHIAFYLDLLRLLNENDYQTIEINVAFADIRIIEKMIDCFGVDRKEVMRNTQNPLFHPFKLYSIELPETVGDYSEISIKDIERYQIKKSISLFKKIQEKPLNALRTKNPNVNFRFDLERIAGIGYYQDLCFKITAKNSKGQEFPLVDGGFLDWAQKLLTDQREKLLISGFGSELFCRNFKEEKEAPILLKQP